MLLLKKKGFPEDSELVICTVTSVQSHSVFCTLEEYGLSGMIHISEVSPGRIRNIRDFVKESKVIVCKVLRVNQDRGHVDLSLRRVTEAQKRNKTNDIKQQQKSEKIIEVAAQKMGLDQKKLLDDLAEKILKEYPSIFVCFSEVADDKISLTSLKIDKKVADELTAAIKLRIKPIEVEIKGELRLTSFASDGVEVIKDALKKVSDSGLGLQYIRAGKYMISVRAANYKIAEQILERTSNEAIAKVAAKEGFGEFVREE